MAIKGLFPIDEAMPLIGMSPDDLVEIVPGHIIVHIPNTGTLMAQVKAPSGKLVQVVMPYEYEAEDIAEAISAALAEAA